MTDTSTLPPRISDDPTGSSYVEWSAIFAGAILTSAIIVLMTAFGSAIGLSLVSPYHGPSPIIFYIVLALWFTWITVSSFVAGGYVTGRMRRPIDGARPHEVHVRDGVHGLVVWALAVAIGTSLATLSISSAVTTLSLSSAVKGSADLAKSGASSMPSGVASVADPIGYSVDNLLRIDDSVSAAKSGLAGNSGTTETPRQEISRILVMSAANGSVSSDDRAFVARVVATRSGLAAADAEKRVDSIFAQVKAAADKTRDANETARKAGIILALSLAPNADPLGYGVEKTPKNEANAPIGNGGTMEASRQEVSRILLMGAVDGSLNSDDRAYLARVVAARTGLSQADAEKRVDALSAQMKTSADKVRAATETARKAGVLLAFLTAASMVLGAAAAWWGAGVGGRHRDENFDASPLTRW
jgi:nucleoid DNA-binding protein